MKAEIIILPASGGRRERPVDPEHVCSVIIMPVVRIERRDAEVGFRPLFDRIGINQAPGRRRRRRAPLPIPSPFDNVKGPNR